MKKVVLLWLSIIVLLCVSCPTSRVQKMIREVTPLSLVLVDTFINNNKIVVTSVEPLNTQNEIVRTPIHISCGTFQTVFIPKNYIIEKQNINQQNLVSLNGNGQVCYSNIVQLQDSIYCIGVDASPQGVGLVAFRVNKWGLEVLNDICEIPFQKIPFLIEKKGGYLVSHITAGFPTEKFGDLIVWQMKDSLVLRGRIDCEEDSVDLDWNEKYIHYATHLLQRNSIFLPYP